MNPVSKPTPHAGKPHTELCPQTGTPHKHTHKPQLLESVCSPPASSHHLPSAWTALGAESDSTMPEP
ncbi:unnamed protein product [Eretmochelys imbricata]